MPIFDRLFDKLFDIVSLLSDILDFPTWRVLRKKKKKKKKNKQKQKMEPVTFIAGVAAVMQAIQTWIAVRDRKKAAREFSTTLSIEKRNPSTIEEGRALSLLIPEPIFNRMSDRVESCWKQYETVLYNEDFLPAEIDDATVAVRKCICRELRRLYDLNGFIPEGKLRDYWLLYCVNGDS